jgi:5'-3' exonuclease
MNNIIIDGNYLFHKSVSVLKGWGQDATLTDALQTKEQQGIFFRKCITDCCYAINNFTEIGRIVIVFDLGKSWRKEYYPEYKNKIKDPSDEEGWKNFYAIMDKFKRFMSTRGFIISSIEGLEGDDLLVYWVEQLAKNSKSDSQIIVTGDADMVQSVTGNNFVYCNNSSNLKLYHAKGKMVQLKNSDKVKYIEVNNNEFTLKKILVGDGGDNVPNICTGMGDKTAEGIVQKANENSLLGCEFWDSGYIEFIALLINAHFKFKKDEVALAEKVYRNAKLMQLKTCWLSEQHQLQLQEEFKSKLNTFTYKGEFTLSNILKDEQN